MLPQNSKTVIEVTPDKKIVWRYEAKPKTGYSGGIEIHAVQRLDNGLTAVAESGNCRIVEVDRDGKIVHEIPLKVKKPNAHRDTRMVRHLDNDHYLVCHEGEGRVCEYDHDGNPPANAELLALLGEDLIANRFNLKRLLREIALSEAYQRSSEMPFARLRSANPSPFGTKGR